MSKKLPFTAKGYYHQTILRTAYLWLPVFAIVIFICSYFEKFRFILYLSVGGATYAFIIDQLKKKAVQINFSEGKIQIDNIPVALSAVENYYISLPLNELIMLRVKTKEKNEAVYVEKEQQENIKEFFRNNNIPEKKISYDNYLQYGHLILPFVGLLICAVVYKLHYYIQYGFN
ncbi:hypothetical protein A0O34_03550 [Chryseobacterium glaciei]|uniref:Uncharacterized protein n=1 Tax=Chryseobacterium glaciei TaxID=1685010 RepID=A0A172XS14_9FLAO|nr:hypothetical protein [Chryseobacterium glaciei]ANF49670.1 hypothetical protein A0O34_03550 [Chryseobacterium glaciei]